MIAGLFLSYGTCLLLETLADFVLPMKGLRTLTLYHCASPSIFLLTLHPNMDSSGAVVCPELEELMIEHRKGFDIEVIVGMAAARALRGAKLKTVIFIRWHRSVYTQPDVSELKKHVVDVECSNRWDDDYGWVRVYNL